MFKRFASQAWISSDSEAEGDAESASRSDSDSEHSRESADDASVLERQSSQEEPLSDECVTSIPDARSVHNLPDNQDAFTRGKYHCRLCPNRILLNEEALQRHLSSKGHLKREKAWTSQAPTPVAKTDSAPATVHVDQQALQHSARAPRQSSVRHARRSEAKRENLNRKKAERALRLTEDEILRRKEKFQLKKRRRLLKKE